MGRIYEKDGELQVHYLVVNAGPGRVPLTFGPAPVPVSLREGADQIVGRAHLGVASLEGLGHLEVMGQLGQLAPADNQPQPQTTFAEARAPALVLERVVDTLAGPGLL